MFKVQISVFSLGLVSLIQSPVHGQRPGRGQPLLWWEPASEQVSTIENRYGKVGAGVRGTGAGVREEKGGPHVSSFSQPQWVVKEKG